MVLWQAGLQLQVPWQLAACTPTAQRSRARRLVGGRSSTHQGEYPPVIFRPCSPFRTCTGICCICLLDQKLHTCPTYVPHGPCALQADFLPAYPWFICRLHYLATDVAANLCSPQSQSPIPIHTYTRSATVARHTTQRRTFWAAGASFSCPGHRCSRRRPSSQAAQCVWLPKCWASGRQCRCSCCERPAGGVRQGALVGGEGAATAFQPSA